MKVLHFKTPLWIVMMNMFGVLFVSSCVNYPQETWIVNVADMKSDTEEEWKLEYDYKGRLVRYGETTLSYEGNRISVGNMEWNCKKEKQFSAVFYRTDGEVDRSESYCLLESNGIGLEAHKETNYYWEKDTLFMYSRYEKVNGNALLRTVKVSYIFDEEHRLVEIISRYYNESGEEASSCHSYLDYDSPISFVSNLNLMAYIADREELDTFLFLLLYMNQDFETNILPNQIRHCVNRGESTYIADCLYRMVGEKLVRMEIVSKQIELKERLDFQYYEE